MTTLHADLFPETLLVNRQGDSIYTTSVKVAEYFGKNHKDVLRAIDQILADLTIPPLAHPIFDPQTLLDNDPVMASVLRDLDGDRGRIFALTIRTVPGPKGAVRSEKMYHLSHDGFAILAMGFAGRRALIWKLRFLQAFRQMEAELHARTTRFAAALDQVRPSLRPVVDGTQAGLKRAAIAAPLGKSCAAVTYHRGQARRLGLLND